MAPKSNASYLGIEKALSNIRKERLAPVPNHLKSASYSGAARLGAGIGYKYPHNYKGHIVDQEYLGRKEYFFFPSDEGYEKVFKKRLYKRRNRQ
jgi:putative ATPase